jgi:hypothetical protein
VVAIAAVRLREPGARQQAMYLPLSGYFGYTLFGGGGAASPVPRANQLPLPGIEEVPPPPSGMHRDVGCGEGVEPMGLIDRQDTNKPTAAYRRSSGGGPLTHGFSRVVAVQSRTCEEPEPSMIRCGRI